MPRGRPAKPGALESLLQKEIRRSVGSALNQKDLATSKDIKALIDEVRSLRKVLARAAALKIKAGAKKSRAGRKPTHKNCTRHGCNKPHYAKGLCASHYQKQRRDSELAKAKTKKKVKRTAAKKKRGRKKATKKKR